MPRWDLHFNQVNIKWLTQVELLVSMGFSREQAVSALDLCALDLDAAADYLISS